MLNVRDKLIVEFRREGRTLQETGTHFGLTKERIRQILLNHEVIVPLSEQNAAKLIGVSSCHLGKLRKEGLINPRHSLNRYWYNSSDIKLAIPALQKRCKHCGISIPLYRNKYCQKCSDESRRYHYPFLTKISWRKIREKRKRLLTTDKISREKGIYGLIGKLNYDVVEDKVQCHICGRWYCGLGQHVSLSHRWTADEYREEFGLNRKQGLVCEGLWKRLRLKAKKQRLWEQPPSFTMDRNQLREYFKNIKLHGHKRRIQSLIRPVMTVNELREENLKKKKWECLCGEVFPTNEELRLHRKACQFLHKHGVENVNT